MNKAPARDLGQHYSFESWLINFPFPVWDYSIPLYCRMAHPPQKLLTMSPVKSGQKRLRRLELNIFWGKERGVVNWGPFLWFYFYTWVSIFMDIVKYTTRTHEFVDNSLTNKLLCHISHFIKNLILWMVRTT